MLASDDASLQNATFRGRLWYVLTNFSFMMLMIVMTCLFYIVAGLQFWMTDFLVNVWMVEEVRANQIFTFIALVPPVIGVVTAGWLFDKIGGYTSPQTMPICFGVGMFGAACGLIASFSQNLNLTIVTLGL